MAQLLKPLVRLLPKTVQLEAFAWLQQGQLFKPAPSGIIGIKHPSQYGLTGVEPIHLLTQHATLTPAWFAAPPHSGAPLVIAFHGNTGHWGDVGPITDKREQRDYRIHWLKAMQQQGAGILAIHLPGFGLHTQEIPSEEAFRIAISGLHIFLEERQLAKHPIVLAGESMGAAAAAIAAVHLTQHGIIPTVVGMIAPFSTMAQRVADDLPQLTADQIAEVLEHPLDVHSMLQHLPNTTRLYIAHPAQDTTTHPYHSERLRDEAQARGLPVQHELLENSLHIVWDPAHVTRQMLSFVTKH